MASLEEAALLNTEEQFRAKETINGTTIMCHFDGEYNDYVLYFPQINLGEEANEQGVSDQLFRISEDSSVAKQVYEFAKKLAETDKDIYSIFKKTKEFARTL